MQAVNVLPMVQDEEQAKAKHSHNVSSQRQQEEEEIAVVSPADAVVHPWTVVVEVLHHEDYKTKVRRSGNLLYTLILHCTQNEFRLSYRVVGLRG